MLLHRNEAPTRKQTVDYETQMKVSYKEFSFQMPKKKQSNIMPPLPELKMKKGDTTVAEEEINLYDLFPLKGLNKSSKEGWSL